MVPKPGQGQYRHRSHTAVQGRGRDVARQAAVSQSLHAQITGLALASTPARTTWPAASSAAEIWACPATARPCKPSDRSLRRTGVTSAPTWTPRSGMVMTVVAAEAVLWQGCTKSFCVSVFNPRGCEAGHGVLCAPHCSAVPSQRVIPGELPLSSSGAPS